MLIAVSADEVNLIRILKQRDKVAIAVYPITFRSLRRYWLHIFSQPRTVNADKVVLKVLVTVVVLTIVVHCC
jgi:hypothetical protein